tara:strand:- start:88 stop:486 length:399 start_codon:yes stop_codon:yes gene_type:complete
MSEEEFDETKYDKLHKELDIIFPNAPFAICCIDDIKELDEVFTKNKNIIIKDDRANESNYYYSNLNKNELAQYVDYLVIKQKDDVPITLRQILTEMSNSLHYNKSIIMEDFHRFLEGFDKMTDVEYLASFGS